MLNKENNITRPINLKYDKNIFKPGDTHILYNNIKDGKEQNIYFVSTPSQMISAIEAQNHFQTKNNVLVVLFFNTKVINEIFSILKHFPYDKLITYQNSAKKIHNAFIAFLNHISKAQYNYAFVGYNSIQYRRMIANIQYKELYSLDTASHAISMQEAIYNDGNLSQVDPYYISKKKRTLKSNSSILLYKMHGYTFDAPFSDLNFFTVFNITPYKTEKIITHNYTYVKSLFLDDESRYQKILLSIYKSSMSGHKKILSQSRVLDISLNEKSIRSSIGTKLEVYPDAITTIKGYQERLITSLYAREEKYLSSTMKSDVDYLVKLQNALIYKDVLVFEKTVQFLLEKFQVRILDIVASDVNNKTKRISEILITLTEVFKLIVYSNSRFERLPAVNRKMFFSIFETLILFKPSVEKILILSHISTLFSVYSKSILNSDDINHLKNYFIQYQNRFKTKQVEVLTSFPDDWFIHDSNLRQVAEKTLTTSIEKQLYKQSAKKYYETLILQYKLEKNVDTLSHYFISTNFKIANIEKHLNALGILIEKSKDFKAIERRVLDIYAKATYAYKYRIKAGLLLVKAYWDYNNKIKARKLFLQILNKLGCKDREIAVQYLNIMKYIEMDTINKPLFEKFYNQYIFGNFIASKNSNVIIDFLDYQKYLYNQASIANDNKGYSRRPINLKYNKNIFKPGDTHILYNNIKDGEEQNIYFVSTPSQMISAIEAQNHFQTKNNVLVVLFFVVMGGRNIDQIFGLAKYFPFDKLITYQNKSAVFFISFIPFLKMLKKEKYNTLFFGFNTILYRRIVANLKYKKLFYLDDGVHTITTHEDTYNENRVEIKPEYIPYPKTLNFLKMVFVYGIKGLKADTTLSDLNFFTVYNLETYKEEEIIKHDYSHVRSLFLNKEEVENSIYVLGQPLVNNVGVSQELYVEHLIDIFKSYSDYKNIFYVPHRLEILYTEVENYISEKENISIFRPDQPIEFYFLNNLIYPEVVVSFITSALFNIAKLFPKTKTQAYEIDITYLDKHHQYGIEQIYKHYRNENIEIIPLKKENAYHV